MDAAALAAAGFPKRLVVGAKGPPAGPGRELADALVQALVRRLGVEVVRFEGSGHVPQAEEPERFNELLRATWAVPEPGGKW